MPSWPCSRRPSEPRRSASARTRASGTATSDHARCWITSSCSSGCCRRLRRPTRRCAGLFGRRRTPAGLASSQFNRKEAVMGESLALILIFGGIALLVLLLVALAVFEAAGEHRADV